VQYHPGVYKLVLILTVLAFLGVLGVGCWSVYESIQHDEEICEATVQGRADNRAM
jgi:hypothetical protein